MQSATWRATLLLVGLAAALGLRLAVSGATGARSPAGGLLFAAVLFALAAAPGWRPERIRLPALATGVAGGLALCLLPGVAVLVGGGGHRAGVGGYPVFALAVTAVALAEEALLRGALWAAVGEAAGPVAAVTVGAAAFALLHVPLYGGHVVPLDFAVGVWLGGLRLAAGSWAAPAAAHAFADLAAWWLR